MKSKADDLLKSATQLSDRLNALQLNKTNVNYKVNNLQQEFEEAQRNANQAHAVSQQLSDKYE